MDTFNSMSPRYLFTFAALFMLIQSTLLAQQADSVYSLTGIVYDEQFMPVAATHVINIHTRAGDVSDTLGIFHLPVRDPDTLLIRNIAFRDTLVAVSSIVRNRYIILSRKAYPLLEARIFEWGSSYEDFKEAMTEMGNQESLGASLGLPTQDPDYVPMEMNEKAIRSAGLLLTSPITFFYQNFNKKAKTARKVYWLEKNKDKHETFERVTGPETLAEITGLSGSRLEQFQTFMLERFTCTIHCTELALYEEIHSLWDLFQKLDERGML